VHDGYGSAGAYVFEGGVSASYHTAQFWGLTEPVSRPAARVVTPAAIALGGAIPVGEVQAPPAAKAQAKKRPPGRIQKIIEDALRAAGLVRR
jgi:hypothetical protein